MASVVAQCRRGVDSRAGDDPHALRPRRPYLPGHQLANPVVIAGMLPLATALTKTGATTMMADALNPAGPAADRF